MELSKVQNEAADFYTGCCNVIASAGSGKTSTLVNRIVRLIKDHDVDPDNILAITFSKKAKENMAERLEKMIPEYVPYLQIETFHSFGYRIIRQYSEEKYEILDVDWKKVKIIEEIMMNVYHQKNPDGRDISEILKYISGQKNQMKKPDPSKEEDAVYQEYENYKQERGLIDFDDMLVKCYEILSTDKTALDSCQEKYRFILADEMQDTNDVQFAMIQLLGQKYHNVFFVGDPLQCVYQWRGSNNQHMLDFDKEWPEAKIIHLNKNYRSSNDIVTVANHFAQCIPESQHKNYVESIADKGKFEVPHYNRYHDESDEAEEIAEKIKQYIQDGYSYKDIAILTRTNAQLQYFETALYKSEVPYVTVGGMSFTDRKEVKIVLSYLMLAANYDNDSAFEYIYNRPNRYLGQAFLQDVKKTARKEKSSYLSAMFKVTAKNWKYKNGVNGIYSAIKVLTGETYQNVGEMIHVLREYLNLDSYVSKDLCDDDDSRVENLNVLEHIASNYKDVKRFLSFIEKITVEKKNKSDAVQLMTIHKSKGLEFPVVFVAGANKGTLPHKNSNNLDEEKRLMYVAITRAEKILNVSSTEMCQGRYVDESEFIPLLFS